jgi:hypothetical protein
MSRSKAIEHWKFIRSEMRYAVLDCKESRADEARFTGVLTPSDVEKGWMNTFRLAFIIATFMLAFAYLGLVKQRYGSKRQALRNFIATRKSSIRVYNDRTLGAHTAWDNWQADMRLSNPIFHTHEDKMRMEASNLSLTN